MIVGIIGNGFVGKATQLIKCSIIEKMYVYDVIPEKCNPLGLKFSDLTECDVIFIALPTPMNENGSCYLGIVEKCVEELKQTVDINKTCLILRSTVPAGTSDRLNINFMPEFLTEKNWKEDFINCKNWIFGCDENDKGFRIKITELFKCAFDEKIINNCNLHFTNKKEAEMVKYVRNCFLALKVSFFNEIEEFTQIKNIDYENVRYLSTLDDRIGSSHSKIGSDGHRGFGGTCFPKDTNALVFEMEQNKMKSFIIKSAVQRNETVDRPEKDWINDKGRAHV